ncbi:50S ribosomal protein L9 [Howardella ureilytica]|nr:50S ribosomal protein L9 [Lachnospiraceae bacterium]MDY2955988.1 50S ribosomal protein L9 [Lachnospiraceae bacterium]
MKVILNEDIKSLGKKGDVVEVSDGYGRNFLISKGKAKEANASNLSILNDIKSKEAHNEQLNLEACQKTAMDIAGVEIKIPIKVGEGGKVFGAVSTKELSEELEKQTGIKVDKKKFKLDESIKNPGFFEIPVRLHKEVTATLKVIVTADN